METKGKTMKIERVSLNPLLNVHQTLLIYGKNSKGVYGKNVSKIQFLLFFPVKGQRMSNHCAKHKVN